MARAKTAFQIFTRVLLVFMICDVFATAGVVYIYDIQAPRNILLIGGFKGATVGSAVYWLIGWIRIKFLKKSG